MSITMIIGFGVLAVLITGLVLFLIGLEEATDEAHSKPEELSSQEKALVGEMRDDLESSASSTHT